METASLIFFRCSSLSLPSPLQWLIYRNAQAEERYGKGGYVYRGNGEYGQRSRFSSLLSPKLTTRPPTEPLDGAAFPSQQHAVHGAPPPQYGTQYGSA